jgi:hypothetical protein
MTPQEVKPFPALPEVDHAGLVRVQDQAQPAEQRPSAPGGLLGLFPRAAQHHEVVRVTDQLPDALGRPGLVESVQIDIGQQR